MDKRQAILHGNAIATALDAAEAAHPGSPELAALHAALSKARARIADHFDEAPHVFGGTEKPPGS
jgi:hypothetical protein